MIFCYPQQLRAQLFQPRPMAFARVAQGPQQSITTQSVCFPVFLVLTDTAPPQENVKQMELGVAKISFV